MADAPTIVVFDSGLGGLTVFREVAKARPDARFVYVADDAGFPYGDMPEEALITRILHVIGKAIAEHAARQFISHGHIKVNGKRVTIASFRVKVGDVVEVKDKSKELALVLEAQALAERDVPDYIEVDGSKLTAKMTRIPLITDVPYPVQMEPHLVVEYYSR